MIRFIQLFFFLSFLQVSAFKYEVTVAAVFRDEARFLKEWIEFHRLIGVEHFYLYNHLSQDNCLDVLSPYIQEGIVEVFSLNEEARSRRHWNKLQEDAYLEAAKKAKKESRWVAFIDTDEFIFPVEDKTLPQFLSHYQDYGAVTINWLVFGTSEVEFCDPNRLMIEQLVFRAEDGYSLNREFKTIAQSYCLNTDGPFYSAHSMPLIKGCFMVNANKQRITSVTRDSSQPIHRIRIHHYFTRDQTFLEEVKLGRPNGRNPDKARAVRDAAAAANQIEDRSILIYAEDLRQRVFSK